MAIHERTIIASVPMAGVNLGSGVTAINAETYDGDIPGPLITVEKGDTLIIRLINDLPHPVGIHWHGIELHNYADGTEITQNEVPGAPLQNLNDGTPAGGTFLYKFDLPKEGLFWYHTHHHHSTNAVFRGLYGMIIVKDSAVEAPLVGSVLPTAANTRQLVLSDITVCHMAGMNTNPTYPNPTTVFPVADRQEWMSGATAQTGPTPLQLCETEPLNDHGHTGGPVSGEGVIPNVFRMDPPMPLVPLTVEGQTVLVNGRIVRGRKGGPLSPQMLDAVGDAPIPAAPGQGFRFQILNAATTRYFRLILTDTNGNIIPLLRVGGEGGILNNAILEGGMMGTYDTKYLSGEILIPAGTRADVVAIIPPGTAAGVCTLWTRDFPRVGGAGWPQIPTVPILHIDVSGMPVASPTVTNGTALRPGAPHTFLGAPVATPFLTPAGFAPPKMGMPNPDIRLTVSGGGVNGINSIHGMFEGMPYTNQMTNGHIGSTRYAKANDILQFTVVNATGAHHPFHLHGFSFQAISLAPNGGATIYTWTDPEYRDNFDVPSLHTVTFKVHLSPRPLSDGITVGGALGRWLFHCHIFFHAHHGMIGELVVTDPDGTGSEKPNVNVHGSWEYTPSGGVARRTGTYFHPDGDSPITLTSSVPPNPTDLGGGNWEWISPGLADQTNYVYITAEDPSGRKDQAVFRLKVGGPADASDNGDPHIHTVDGKRYDFQSAGEFTLLKDREGLEVQARQTPVLTANPITDSYSGLKSCVSLNTAVAIKVGTHRVSYQPGKEKGQFQFFLDGKPSRLTTRGINLDGHHVSGFNVNGVMALRVDYAHHAVVIATPLHWSSHNVWYLNISISRTQGNEGLMGAIPQNTWLPLLPSGASVGPMPGSLNERYHTLYTTFADAWRVTNKTSLFVYEPGTSTATFTDKDWPAGEPPCNLKPQFEIPGWVIPQGMDIEKAKQVCQAVTDAGLNQDCVFDVATTGDAEFARAYLITQEIKQRSTAVQIVSIKRGEVTAVVARLTGKQPVPKGKVTFFVDDQEKGIAIDTDASGRAHWKISGVDKGDHTIRAVYTPVDEAINYASGSPNLKVSLRESTLPGGGNTGGGLFTRWYVWVALLVLIALLVWIFI